MGRAVLCQAGGRERGGGITIYVGSIIGQLGEYADQKIEELPPEEQEAAEMKLIATADTLVDTIDTAYRVTEKACDSIIDSLDELEG